MDEKRGVCVAGSLNIDLVTRVRRHPGPGETVHADSLTRKPGGKGANQALAAARAEAATVLIGRVGADDIGADYRAALQRRGLDCSGVTATAGLATGHAFISIDDTGENTIIVVPGANGAVTPDDIERAAGKLAAASVLLLQFELPPETVAAAARIAAAAGTTVVLNPSPFRVPEPSLLADVDVIVVNEHEAAALGETGVSTVVTQGARGAHWGGIRVAAPNIDPVDTTGAGDAFTGSLAAALANGLPRRAALTAAAAAGTRACGQPGAQGWSFDD